MILEGRRDEPGARDGGQQDRRPNRLGVANFRVCF